VNSEPPWRNTPKQTNDLAGLVQEAEVEGEAHAECVHAGATGDEQAWTGLVQVEVGEAEEAGAK
jgi:hypothetical protein